MEREELGNVILTRRKELNLTQEQLADLLKKEQKQNIGKIEKGQLNISYDRLTKILTALNLKLSISKYSPQTPITTPTSNQKPNPVDQPRPQTQKPLKPAIPTKFNLAQEMEKLREKK
jgi:transcriptional regulator with XRE-family HTH domain